MLQWVWLSCPWAITADHTALIRPTQNCARVGWLPPMARMYWLGCLWVVHVPSSSAVRITDLTLVVRIVVLLVLLPQITIVVMLLVVALAKRSCVTVVVHGRGIGSWSGRVRARRTLWVGWAAVRILWKHTLAHGRGAHIRRLVSHPWCGRSVSSAFLDQSNVG